MGSEPTPEKANDATHLDWGRLHNVLYRRRKIWAMKWSGFTSFRDILVTPAAYGGPVAVLQLRLKGAILSSQPKTPLWSSDDTSPGTPCSQLEMYTAGGTLISSTPWVYEAMLTTAWSTDGMLVCIFETGVVRAFSVFGEVKYCFNVDDHVKAEGGLLAAVIDAEENALVVFTKGMRLYANMSLTHRSCIRLADPPLSSIPISMRIIVQGEVTSADRNVITPSPSISVLLASETGALFIVNPTGSRKIPLSGGPFVSLHVSPSRALLAAQSSDNAVYIFSTQSDFSEPLDSATIPAKQGEKVQLAWVAEDCIACHVVSPPSPSSRVSQHTLFVGGPANQWLTYLYGSEDITLVSEYNGLRVVGCQSCFSIERVARSTENIFTFQSRKPSALLYSAFQLYEDQNIQANDVLSEVLPNLSEALCECIDAATRETDSAVVVPLLRAVTFGRLYLRESVAVIDQYSSNSDIISSDEQVKKQSASSRNSCFETRLSRAQRRISRQYISACRDLRVALTLHGLPLEMCLTVPQLRHIGAPRLLRLLSNRRMHLLALRIGEFWGLGYPPQPVRIYGPLEVDCSRELRDICAAFWATEENTSRQVYSALMEDATRPAGVSLALTAQDTKSPERNQTLSMGSPKTYSLVPTYKLPPAAAETHVSPKQMSREAGEASMCYVLEHWAREKISCSTHLTDQQLLEVLRSTLATYSRMQPKVIKFALEAVRLSRPHLATLLLQFEPRSRVQVRVLLRLAEVDLAVKQAVQAGDVDLIFECLAMVESESQCEHSGQNCNRFSRILSILARYPILWDFYEALCVRGHKLHWLQQLYEESGNVERAGWVCLRRALTVDETPNDDNQKRHLAHSAAFFGSSFKHNTARELRVIQQLTLEHLELLNLQKQWETLAIEKKWSRLPCKLEGLTLGDTFKQLYIRHQNTEIQTLQKLFSVSQKRALKLHIRALIEHDLIDELVALIQSPGNVTSVGGAEFFLSALRRSGKVEAISRLMPQLKKSADSKTLWFPKVFQTFETGDIRGVSSLLSTLRDERGVSANQPARTGESTVTRRGGLQGAGGSLMGSLTEAFSRGTGSGR